MRSITTLPAFIITALMAASALSVATHPALAEDPAAAGSNLTERMDAGSTVLQLATLVEPGEDLQWGDMINVRRSFGTWTLMCDMRPSVNKRICAAGQIVTSDKSSLVWRIAMTTQMQPVVVLTLPGNLDVAKGLRLGFSGLEKTITGSQWSCSPQGCVAAFPYEGFVQAAIGKSPDIRFSYSLKPASGASADMAGTGSTPGGTIDVTATASMAGLSEALDAAATDPFGKFVPVKSEQAVKNDGKQKPAKGKAADPKSAQTTPDKPKTPAPFRPVADKDADASGIAKTTSNEPAPRRDTLY